MTTSRDNDFWRDSRGGKTVRMGVKTDAKQVDRSDTKISIWLAGAIIFFLAVIFIITGYIIREAYYRPPVARTSLERELIKFETMVKTNPEDIDARIGLAGVYLQLNQPEKAVEELNTANGLEPYSWDTLFGLGIAYEAMNNKRLAASYFKKAVDMDPSNELAFYKLGRIYLSQKHYELAIDAYKKTLGINPTLADAHYCLGLCYEKTGKKKLAVNEYKEALRYVDSYPEAAEAIQRLR
jgi:tetratricopeptide (TPR) repeat protein